VKLRWCTTAQWSTLDHNGLLAVGGAGWGVAAGPIPGQVPILLVGQVELNNVEIDTLQVVTTKVHSPDDTETVSASTILGAERSDVGTALGAHAVPFHINILVPLHEHGVHRLTLDGFDHPPHEVTFLVTPR